MTDLQKLIEAAEFMAKALRDVRDRNKSRRAYYDSEVQRICRDALKSWGEVHQHQRNNHE